jgi:FlaA1/EpsC-like NDP-sugar epimerase
MGQPVRIADLARDMIRLSGLSEDEIRIVYTGLRPGEKLYEEVLAADENSLPTPHPKLRIAMARPASLTILPEVDDWLNNTITPTAGTVKAGLTRWVAEYQPQ